MGYSLAGNISIHGLGMGCNLTTPDSDACVSINSPLVERPMLKIRNYDRKQHLPHLALVAHGMRQSERAYPPPEFCGESIEDVTYWVDDCYSANRWVATYEESIIGHISLTEPESYLTDFLQSYSVDGAHDEISKFFVHPDCRKFGAGSLLFSHALAASAKPKALAVLEGSYAARAFYEHHGMVELGQFDGISGINHVFVEARNVE